MFLSPQYSAGLFDGEGSVGVYPSNKNTGYTLKISLANTFEEVLESLKETYGGAIYQRTKGNEKHRAIRAWHVNDGNTQLFVADITPYAIIKKRQLELAQEYLNTISPDVHYRGKWNPMPDEIRDTRKRIEYDLRVAKEKKFNAWLNNEKRNP